MNLVKMQLCGDCGPACLAMVLGESIESGRARIRQVDPQWTSARGTPGDLLIKALGNAGLCATESVTWDSLAEPAIVTVPSLNHRGLLHYIVWDGEQWLDPSIEPFQYPRDAPVMGGVTQVYWACVITWKKLPTMSNTTPYEAVLISPSLNPADSLLETGVAGAWVLSQLSPAAPELGQRGEFGQHRLLTWPRPIVVKESNGETWTFMAAIIHSHEDIGIVLEYYPTVARAEAAWQELGAEYQRFLTCIAGDRKGDGQARGQLTLASSETTGTTKPRS